MRTGTSAMLLLLAGVASCAAPERPELDYLPPSGQPAADRSAFVRQQPWLVWGNILDHLQQQGVQVTAADEAAGRIVVTYSGDPEPYVDCGWIVIYEGDEFERVPAARSEASFLRRRGGEEVSLERDLALDARMTVEIEPSGEDAIVRADSTYVLTKTIEASEQDEPIHAETIQLASGQSDTFTAGTRCQPTGELERLVFDALPTVAVAGS
jgi:hypothetical protein